MASPISSSFPNFFLLSTILFLCSSKKLGFAFAGRGTIESKLVDHTQTVQVSSLLPSTTCGPSTKGPNRKASLKVVHKYGPCSQLNQDHQAKTPTHAEILQQDEARVKSIHSKLSKQLGSDDVRESKASTNIPAKSGSIVNVGNYIVTVGLGTPKKDLTLIFDTGSDLTWTQCQPCARKCYQQKEPILDPSASRTYSNITCSSSLCSQLSSATGNTPSCSGASTCVYGIQYGDQSFSIGFFAKETLTLTPTDVFNGFLFGCGQDNQGLFGSSAGLLGLGRDPLSIVQQTAPKYGRFFSYCLPSSSSSTGHLTFGKGNGGSSNAIKFTPFSKISDGTSFYGLDTTGITVGGRKLPISASVFSNSGTIIDSGTVISRLPPAAYDALKMAFKDGMKQYPLTDAFSILDTCYDFSKYDSVTFPKIAFSFGGGVNLELDKSGVFYAQKISQVCLAFAGNSDASDVAIFGNVQQKRLEVVYDVAGGKVGFGLDGCT